MSLGQLLLWDAITLGELYVLYYLMIWTRHAQHVARGQHVACASYVVRADVGNEKHLLNLPLATLKQLWELMSCLFTCGDTHCVTHSFYKNALK